MDYSWSFVVSVYLPQLSCVSSLLVFPLHPHLPSPPTEEEWKRLQSLGGEAARYNQIGFSYGSVPAPGGGTATQESASTPAVDDEPYLPPAALNVPEDMAQVRRRDGGAGMCRHWPELCLRCKTSQIILKYYVARLV